MTRDQDDRSKTLAAALAAAPAVSSRALTAFREQRGRLAYAAAERVAADTRDRTPERWAEQRDFIDDAVLRFGELLESVFRLGLYAVLAEETRWYLSAFAARGLHAGAYRSLVDGWVQAIRDSMQPPERDELSGPLEILRRHVADLAARPEPPATAGLVPEAQRLLQLLIAQDRGAAAQLLESLTRSGARAADVLEGVVMPSVRAIGTKWQHNEIGMYQEHAATAAVQSLIALMAARAAAPASRGSRALVACVPGEEHALGTTALAHFLEDEGWSVLHLGSSLPPDELVRAVGDFHPHVLFLSLSMIARLPAAIETATAIRAKHPAVRILFGGRGALLGRDALCPHADAIVESFAAAHATALGFLATRA